MDQVEIIDAHHHLWDIEHNYYPWLRDEPMIPFRYGDYSRIRRSFMPEDYALATHGFNVVGNVTMEGEWDPTDPVGETRWIHRIAAEHGIPHAHVAQAWLDHDDVEETLAAQASFPLVRSIRHKPRVARSPDLIDPDLPGSMSDPRFRRGYALLSRFGLHFDLQVPWWHLAQARSLTEAFPETTIILNHTGLPSDRSREGLEGWRAAMRMLAVFPKAYVKISGLGLAGRAWSIDDNRGVIRDTIGIFGVERCMFASNFPVDSLVGDFRTIMGGFLEAVRDFSAPERRRLFRDNASEVYRPLRLVARRKKHSRDEHDDE